MSVTRMRRGSVTLPNETWLEVEKLSREMHLPRNYLLDQLVRYAVSSIRQKGNPNDNLLHLR